jgi:hypothetical protein
MSAEVLTESGFGLDTKLKPFVPRLARVPDQKMVVVDIHGDPGRETERLMGPLYAAAYAVRGEYKRHGTAFKVDKLRGRWPASNLSVPRSQWTGTYGLPVPNDVTSVPEIKPEKRVPGVQVTLATWRYGETAQILHVGPFSAEWPTIQKLHAFVESQGYRVVPDSHEEVYLSDGRRTAPEDLKTILICRVRKA